MYQATEMFTKYGIWSIIVILFVNGTIILHWSGFDNHMQTCGILQPFMCIKPFNTKLEVWGVSFIFPLLSEIADIGVSDIIYRRNAESTFLNPLAYTVDVFRSGWCCFVQFHEFIIRFLRLKNWVVNQT